MMKKVTLLFWLFGLLVFSFSCVSNNNSLTETSADSAFSMVFMTDIHLQPELNAIEGFRKAMDTVNKLKPEFVVTGGDLIMDALAQKQTRADSLFALYNKEIKELNMPVYNTIGNHELFGVYPESGIDTTNELYGNKMYLQRIGKTYYSFIHKNWKFFVLDAIHSTRSREYIGLVTSTQVDWIKNELEKTGRKTPIAIVLHIPMLTSYAQFNEGALSANSQGLVVNNSKEILNLFNGYNLKLVLQGHLHILEDNYIKGVHFITGGAVCGGWWKGPHEGTEEGFLYMNFKGEEFDWKYIDYGWTPEVKGKN